MHWRSRAAAAAALSLTAGGLASPIALAEDLAPYDPAILTSLKVNEAESDGTADVLGGADFIELVNASDQPLDITGVIVIDGKIEDAVTDAYVLDGLDPVPAGGYVVLTAGVELAFGLGKGDSAQLFAPGTALEDIASGAATPFETTTWPAGQHTDATWGRCDDATGEFRMTSAATPGAANACDSEVEPPVEEPSELSTTLAITEVESNGDDTDWVEVMNLTDADIDISGWPIKDDDDSRTDIVPAGSVVPAGGLLVIDQESATYPQGFTFGLGNGDMFRLYNPAGELVAKTTWPGHAMVSWSRCPDGTGEWIDAPLSTKGMPNACDLPVRINEVESSGDDTDWVEIINLGQTALDLTGVQIKDDDDSHVLTLPAGTVLAAGEIAAFDTDATEEGFGLGGADSARLFDAEETLLDSYTWESHADTTYGRCPDGYGAFETTASSTKGAANHCAGLVVTQAWPGGTEVSVLDAEDTFGGDMSGIDHADGELWAVQNGDGLLYRMDPDGTVTGEWALTYPSGTGTVDSEGVHAAGDAVYVSSERDNSVSGISRPAVLRYEVTGTSGTLVATDEWNLAADLPGLPANGGLEGITWIPDSWLVAGGLLDQGTGAAYDPAAYPGHGDGLFVVAVEGTAGVYAYALMEDGTFARVATVSTEAVAFALAADVQFDADRDLLWVVCDEACDGRIAAYTLESGVFEPAAVYERPAGMANIANEGFAVGSACVAGSVPTFYVDDADTDGFSLRRGTLPCVGAAFTDVTERNTFFSEISWMADRGIARGWADGTFRPLATATREQIAAFLYRQAGSPAFEAPAVPTFTDVPVGSTFYLEIEWMAATGITEGWADGTFRPLATVRRDQVATFLFRLSGAEAPAPATGSFTDVPRTHVFAAQIEWAASMGITQGWPDGSFRPTAPITREQIAAFLYRFGHLA